MEKPEPGKPILVEIGGSLYELLFTMRTLKAMDLETGISVLNPNNGLVQALQNADSFSKVLYYGLRGKQPEITQDWVDDHVDATMLLRIVPSLAYAVTGRWIEIDVPNADGPRRSTGSASGPSDDTTSAVVSANSGN